MSKRQAVATMEPQPIPVVTEPNMLSNTHRRKNYRDYLKELAVVTKESDRMIKGTFINLDYHGKAQMLPVTFSFRSYGPQVKNYSLIHGHEYELPYSVVLHIKSRVYKRNSKILDYDGSPIEDCDAAIPRFDFVNSSI